MLPDLILYRAIIIKTAWYRHKKRNRDQWNRIESTKINLHTYGSLTYDKEGKNIHGEKTVSSISGAGKIGQLHVKE